MVFVNAANLDMVLSSDAPGSPDSQGSAAMDESDSEAESGTALDADDDMPFPLEGKFRSERDRMEIMAMSDLQRESILAERAAENDRRNQDRQLRRMLQAQEKSKAADGKKRKAGLADLEDDASRRNKVKSVKSERLESYVRQREQRNQQRRKDEVNRTNGRRSMSAGSRGTSRDADGDSEPEYDDRVPVREDPPTFRDFDLVRIGRSNFSKVCFYPDFQEAINGCFARVSIGADRSTGQNIYRMAQIKGMLRVFFGPLKDDS
jgi:RNA polymerase-associated protein RTF1